MPLRAQRANEEDPMRSSPVPPCRTRGRGNPCRLALAFAAAPVRRSASTRPPPRPAVSAAAPPAGLRPRAATESACRRSSAPPSPTASRKRGGADGGGFIRSAYTGVVGASAVGGTTSGVWESPAFTYAGAAGGEATAISLGLDRRASVDQLLAVAGNSAEYTVRLIDVTEGGEALTLIAPTTLAGANSWTGVSRRIDRPGKPHARRRIPDPDHQQLHHRHQRARHRQRRLRQRRAQRL